MIGSSDSFDVIYGIRVGYPNRQSHLHVLLQPLATLEGFAELHAVALPFMGVSGKNSEPEEGPHAQGLRTPSQPGPIETECR